MCMDPPSLLRDGKVPVTKVDSRTKIIIDEGRGDPSKYMGKKTWRER